MIFRRRSRAAQSTPAWPPDWDVPDRFNLVRDVIEARGRDVASRALTYVNDEGIVDRRTHREVAQDAARWAHALRRRAKEPEGCVVIATGAVPETVLALLGALKSGLVAAPVGPDLCASELGQRLRMSGAQVVVADREAEQTVAAALETLDTRPAVLYLDEAVTELRRYTPSAPTEERRLVDPALLLFTAGIGDEPKAVVHSHASVWASRASAEHWLGADDRDLVWATARPGTAEWLWHGVLAPLSVGAELVLHDEVFDPALRMSLLQRLAVTVLCQSPTEYRALAAEGATIRGSLPRLRETVATGEPLDAELVERYVADAGISLRDGLSQAECAVVAGTLAGSPAVPGVLGLGLPGHDVAVIDGDGHVLGADEEGDLALLGRPPTLFTRYLGAADVTAATFRDGWYLTGDRFVRADDGSLRFVRRGDDLIVAGGSRFGPIDVEAAIRSHPLVRDVAAVAGRDAERGTVLKAFVTLVPGAAAPGDLTATLAAHVAEVASAHLAPAMVEVVDELPRTSAGAVRRSELRRLEEERARAAAAEAERSARLAAEAAEAEHARWLAERAEEHRLQQEADRLKAEEERRRLVAEEERRRSEVQEERARLEREAKERTAAERAERERVEREREEQERLARAEAKRAEEERKQAERAEREQAERAQAPKAEQERAEREQADGEPAERAEEERRLREALARDQAERSEREAEAAAETREVQPRLEAEAGAPAHAERDTPALVPAEEVERERLERERRVRERAEREAARRAEEARRGEQEQLPALPMEDARLEDVQPAAAPADVAPPPEVRPEVELPDAAQPGAEPAPTAEVEPISGLAERIRRYANVDEPDEARPFGWRRREPEDDEPA